MLTLLQWFPAQGYSLKHLEQAELQSELAFDLHRQIAEYEEATICIIVSTAKGAK